MFKGLGGRVVATIQLSKMSQLHCGHLQTMRINKNRGDSPSRLYEKYLCPQQKFDVKNVKNVFSINLAQLTGPIILAQYALDDCEAFKP